MRCVSGAPWIVALPEFNSETDSMPAALDDRARVQVGQLDDALLRRSSRKWRPRCPSDRSEQVWAALGRLRGLDITYGNFRWGVIPSGEPADSQNARFWEHEHAAFTSLELNPAARQPTQLRGLPITAQKTAVDRHLLA
jgi:hypothetical protein